MNGLATKNLLKQIHLAPEVEAPRSDSFGLEAMERERRAAKLERAYSVAFKVGIWLILLSAAFLAGNHSRAPEKPLFVASESLARTCVIDHRENCLICTFTDSEGRERHRNAHCPALAPSGLMAWPLGRE